MKKDMLDPKAVIDFETGLSISQMQAIKLLREGHGKTRVARAVGVHPNTITNWCKNKQFAHALDKYQAPLIEDKRGDAFVTPEEIDDKLAMLLVPSINAMGDVLLNRKGSDQARVNAAKFVVNTLFLRLTHSGDFAPKELEELRKSLALVTK